jgi:L-fucono-1,5-lactonase
MDRREVLKFGLSSCVVLAARGAAAAVDAAIPIIDTHIHLFDTTRPGGVPWPEKTDAALYQPALPDRYQRVAGPLGVVGAIAIEASPLTSDNDWLLNVAAKNPMIVGVVGDLIPGTPSYLKDLERLRANTLFLGIRYGNIWDRDLAIDKEKAGFVGGLKQLAAHGLVLDSANPNPALIAAIVDVAEKVPDLRIVVDHLPHSPIPTDKSDLKKYLADLNHLAKNPNVFIKLSEIPAIVNQKVSLDPEYYREHLDGIWNIFGEEHILFGSDWPNSDHVVGYSETLTLVREYMAHKTLASREKFFWRNSLAAYRWHRRSPDQPSP